MQKRKLVIAQNLDEDYIMRINAIIPEWEIIVGKDNTIWQKHLEDAEIIVSWKKEMERMLIQNNMNLRWLQSWSAGVNSLPLQVFEEKKIHITSANGVHAYPISETIFALMLALTRKIHSYIKNQQTKTWHHANLSLELHGKTIALLGIGAIGMETAKIAKAFGMKVIGFRNSEKPEENVDSMYALNQLDEILPICDYVVVTLPYTKETHHLFKKQQFKLMKPSSFFINIGRGSIVVEEDLIHALQSKEIAGAGLDVFEKEPLHGESPLWALENVIITPHTAGSTEHYTKRVIEDIFIPNLQSYIQGSTPSINLVDYQKGY
ncbi:phosphoglycerate dehydrogenase-like enzyme [Cytobacillus eiseniae]|uniref:Phosphoglycerate dehydrogenase-like enzyme n=1 Tax=Cytobacillus eiseniae TaxID=762947 RepID=A0ABS4RDM0_9BACI|nr:D-2-hydroxyacid dehydrogenase [Cytobacillus eiseniae]MBP2240995.1 phosphoglycerate dehydrogenase-like enzyme [Cytobacillus eiseniae]